MSVIDRMTTITLSRMRRRVNNRKHTATLTLYLVPISIQGEHRLVELNDLKVPI